MISCHTAKQMKLSYEVSLEHNIFAKAMSLQANLLTIV